MIGSIYKIEHIDSNIIYIGATLGSIHQRWLKHKNSYNLWNRRKAKKLSLYPYIDQYGIDRFRIVLLKEYDVIDRKHLNAYEQLFINKYRSIAINKTNPFKQISKKSYNIEYYKNNKDKIGVKTREYYKMHQNRLKEAANKPNQCICGGRFTHCHKSRHYKTKKHQLYHQRNVLDNQAALG